MDYSPPAARPSGHRLRRCSLRHPCLRIPGPLRRSRSGPGM